jgi:hypothetical protein
LLPPKNASFQGTFVLITVPSRLRPPNTPLARLRLPWIHSGPDRG